MALIKVSTKGSNLTCAELDNNWDYVLDLANATGELDCSKINQLSLATCLLLNSVIINLQTEIDDTQISIGQVAQDLTDAQTSLQGSINALTTLVNNQNITINDLTTQLNNLIGQFGNLNNTVASFNNRLISIEGRTTTLEAAIATGIIVIWSGLINAVPSGWAFCNGQNNTPDLRDRFIVGGGLSYAQNAVGGSNTHSHSLSGTTSGTVLSIGQMPYHAFSVTVNPHSHSVFAFSGGGNHEGWVDPFYSWGSGNESFGGIDRPDVSSYISTNQAGTQLVSNSPSYGTTNPLGGNEAHSHTFSSGTGNTSNLPLYFALAYIKRI